MFNVICSSGHALAICVDVMDRRRLSPKEWICGHVSFHTHVLNVMPPSACVTSIITLRYDLGL